LSPNRATDGVAVDDSIANVYFMQYVVPDLTIYAKVLSY
jgi:hypothetical protein